MGRLKSLEPAAIARRAFDLMEEYRDVYGLPEQRARAAAIGCLSIEADELKGNTAAQPITRHNYETPRGGFTGRSSLPRWLIEMEDE